MLKHKKMVKDELTTLYTSRYLLQEKTQSTHVNKKTKTVRDEISYLLSQKYLVQS